MPELASGVVTFLFSDIEGSTSLLKQLGREPYAEFLTEHQRLMREAFDEAGGDEIDTQGDAFFAAFRSATDAIAAAVSAQRAHAEHEWPDGVELRVRIDEGTVMRIRLADGAVVVKTKIGAHAGWVERGENPVWVLDQSAGKLVEVDAKGYRVVRTIDLGHELCCVSVGQGHVWVTARTPLPKQ